MFAFRYEISVAFHLGTWQSQPISASVGFSEICSTDL